MARRSLLDRLAQFFVSDLHDENFYRNLPPDEAAQMRSADKIYDQMSQPVSEGIVSFRLWVTRGLGGGLAAALTLLGSQVLSQAGHISFDVALLAILFVLGLGLQLLRQLITIYQDALRRRFAIEFFLSDELRQPAKYLKFTVIMLDVLALILLLIGVIAGLVILASIAVSGAPPYSLILVDG